jgi:hypothetical protein
MKTAEINWQCGLGILCCGNLVDTIMFIRLFNSADLKAQII